MVFSSTTFLFLFLPLLLIIYFLPFNASAGRRRHRNGTLLLFSLIFYAWGEPAFVFIMLAAIAGNWLLAIFMDNSTNCKKLWLTLAVVMDISLLAVFKYASFASKTLAALTGNDAFIVNIALPIGISFFTFQMMSYVFDVYYGNARVQKNPFYVALYITLFPQLIAGPIVRYKQIADEITGRQENRREFVEGFKRFIYGLGKKVLLANYLAQIADNVFDKMLAPSVIMSWLGALAYALQIYYDFSGYSDMAIGLGRMFGFHFLENFNYPYIADSITDFWRRWHISLSSWFRDYVYIPIGGNKVGPGRHILNLFIVWALTGIWHGANWTFLLWGLIYFVFLVLEKYTCFEKKLGAFSHVYTLLVVLLAWVFFRADSIGAGFVYVGRMFGVNASGFTDGGVTAYLKGTWLVLVCALSGCFPGIRKPFEKLSCGTREFLEGVWLFLVFAMSIICVAASTYNPFIYFNF